MSLMLALEGEPMFAFSQSKSRCVRVGIVTSNLARAEIGGLGTITIPVVEATGQIS